MTERQDQQTPDVATAPLALRTHRDDNVVIAVGPIPAGTLVETGTDTGHDIGVVADTDFDLGQKIAVEPIAVGETVRRYGEPIGVATANIEPGQLVHYHNLASTYQSGVTRRTEQTDDHA